MGCGCAGRMRKLMPFLGYEVDHKRQGYIRGDEFIADRDIEEHHTRLMAEIGLKRAKEFFSRTGGRNASEEKASHAEGSQA